MILKTDTKHSKNLVEINQLDKNSVVIRDFTTYSLIPISVVFLFEYSS